MSLNWQYDDPQLWRYKNAMAYRYPNAQFMTDQFDTNTRNFGIVDLTGKLVPMTGLDDQSQYQDPFWYKAADRVAKATNLKTEIVVGGTIGSVLGIVIGYLLFGGKK